VLAFGFPPARATGNRTSHADRNGNVINYSYDALDRPFQVQYKIPGGVVQSTVNYTWDAGNRVTKAVDSIAGTISRTYDGLDDLTQEATPQGTINYKTIPTTTRGGAVRCGWWGSRRLPIPLITPTG
jgi:hypothetical protein